MGARLLPRTLPELFSYCLVLQREAAKRYAELEGLMRKAGAERIADEFERIGGEVREQYELIALGTSGRELPELAGWELAWYFAAPGADAAARSPRTVREAILMALAVERGKQAFYNDVAENSRDGAVRAFAADMANDGQRHVPRLELLLEREPETAALEAGEGVVPPVRELG